MVYSYQAEQLKIGRQKLVHAYKQNQKPDSEKLKAEIFLERLRLL